MKIISNPKYISFCRISFLLMLIAMLSPFSAYGELTATEIVKKSARLITGSTGFKSQFSLQSGNNKMEGMIVGSGDKFHITTPVSQTWFNGKNMWTYNSRSKETILTIPTPQEIAETNPLRLLRTNSTDYKAIFAKTQIKGKHVIVLVPRKSGTGIKRVDIVLSAAGCLPESIKVTPDNGPVSTVKINKIQTGLKISASEFEYPKSKFANIEVVDLR